ncbi:MAG: hypothetical protein JO356_09060 [Acidobacteria bacterium]|nr:hypothetical protein [Acidobacteriota bacterium]
MSIEVTVSRQRLLRGIGACVLFSLPSLATTTLQAKTATGTITGTVTDPTRLPMSDVDIEVENVETGAEVL